MYHFIVQQQSSPEHASRAQRREYQTDVIKLLMDHLSDADVLLNDQAALRVTKGGHQQHIATNVFYFAGRVVDKLWHGACPPAHLALAVICVYDTIHEMCTHVQVHVGSFVLF